MEFALVQHSKAIGSFRNSLSGEQPQVRLALMASLLFGCFESFHGNWESAWQQAYSGLNILGQWRKNKLQGQPSWRIAPIDAELGVALIRLQLQLESYLVMNPMIDIQVTEPEEMRVEEYPPYRFANLSEAFPLAINLASCSVRHSRKAARALNLGSSEVALEEERDALCDSLFQWTRAFRPLFLEAETGQVAGNQDLLGTLLLHTCLMAFEIVLATSLSKNESIFDSYTEAFRRIVFLCRRVFQIEGERRQVDGLKAQFGLGLIMVLYYVATRCRESSIRREAISILREWPSKNGIWDSLQAAQVAEWIMGIEEEAACGEEIPEQARVRMSSLQVTRHKGGIDIECIQGQNDGIWRRRKASLEFQ